MEQADEPRAPLRDRAVDRRARAPHPHAGQHDLASSPASGRSSSQARRAPPGCRAPQLILRKSTYRQFFAPLVEYVEQLRDENPDRDIVVIVPDLVVRHWYHAFLHNNRGTVLRGLLRLRGGPRVVVVNTPFYVKE